MLRRAALVVGVLVAAACGSQTVHDGLSGPSGTPTPGASTPVAGPVPVPVPIPSPVAAPVPVPVPANPSTPAPATPPPTSGGGGTGATGPTAQVTAGVHSYLHNGRLIGEPASTFAVGDVVYLNCTPRDIAGNPIDNHGPLQGWSISSSDGARFQATDTDTFNPDLHAQGPGHVKISCRVDNVSSPTKTLTIQ